MCGYDAASRDRGPLFRLPVTVVRPCRINDKGRPIWSNTQSFKPGQFERHFIAVPDGATWADLRIGARQLEAPQRVVVHALQKLPKRTFRDGYRQFITVEPGSETVRSFKVVGGRTLELCLGQYWSNLAESEFEFELAFHGLMPSDPDLQIDGSRLSARVDVSAPLRDELLRPAATLTTL